MFRQAAQSLRRVALQTIGGGVVVVGTLEVLTHLPSQGRSSEFYHQLTDDAVVPLMRKVLNPEQAHDLAIKMALMGPTHRPSLTEQNLNVSTSLGKIQFSNPVGLAAGFDKDGIAMGSLLQMGFGFVEIGSVTLKPQPGNPSPRMFRLVEDEGIINRYGFNSTGVDAVEENLKRFRQAQRDEAETLENASFFSKLFLGRFGPAVPLSQGVLGINLGKNKTSTTPVADYQALIRQLGPYADYLVINVSSPNTPGLRDLQDSDSLEALLRGCQEALGELENKPPLLVKLAPDLTNDELQDIATVLIQLKIGGIIVTNTTIQRPSTLRSSNKQETGGLSGRPLRDRSTECIRCLYRYTNGEIPIIGVGGIFTGQDAYEKLKAGASLVQVYSGMIYRGPGMVSKIRAELAELMLQNGQRKLEDVVGIDHEELYWQKREENMAEMQKSVRIVDEDEQEERGVNRVALH